MHTVVQLRICILIEQEKLFLGSFTHWTQIPLYILTEYSISANTMETDLHILAEKNNSQRKAFTRLTTLIVTLEHYNIQAIVEKKKKGFGVNIHHLKQQNHNVLN